MNVYHKDSFIITVQQQLKDNQYAHIIYIDI